MNRNSAETVSSCRSFCVGYIHGGELSIVSVLYGGKLAGSPSR
jgi:hypothetical protein